MEMIKAQECIPITMHTTSMAYHNRPVHTKKKTSFVFIETRIKLIRELKECFKFLIIVN